METEIKKVGIAIINYNSMKYLRLTLESLWMVKIRVPFAVCVIDNGSGQEEIDACGKLIEDIKEKRKGADLEFIVAGRNLGFSGGNNVLIKRFLERDDISHICLLNPDVIVTDFWLDYLLEKQQDVIGPVTNAAGNEQTIQIDYTVEAKMRAIDLANVYAGKRHACYKGCMVQSELITFFAALFKKEVIEAVGLLDEQFYPGSYEDDDYCLRIIDAGYNIMIARDCFLHHFGSGSFSGLKMEERKNIGDTNRERFEKKWQRKWKDRTWKLLESCRQDMDFLLKNEKQDWAREQIGTSFDNIEKLMSDWGEAIAFFTAQADRADMQSCQYSGRQLIQMLWVKVCRRRTGIIGITIRKGKDYLQSRRSRRGTEENIESVYRLIREGKAKGYMPICVFAPMYNRENERDGYIQRIKAIDTTVLKDMCRIYLYDEGINCIAMRFDFIDEKHGYIVFNSHNKDHIEAIAGIVKACGSTYIHSLLRFMEDRSSRELWKIFDLEGVRHFWDVHGAVPEEYELSGSELGYQLANNIEEILAGKVSVAVVVTNAMGQHLKQKYPDMKARIVEVPVFGADLLKPVENKKREKNDTKPVITYAGGIQPWQNISLMQDVMEQTRHSVRYKIFVPDSKEFMEMWGERSQEMDMIVVSKTPQELYQEYEVCDFGFIIRDEGPVNRVACPTKIVEYLKFGIIPILKTEHIGDFAEMGMKYLSYMDMLNGISLTEEERMSMAEHNYQILNKLQQKYVEGREILKNIVEGESV